MSACQNEDMDPVNPINNVPPMIINHTIQPAKISSAKRYVPMPCVPITNTTDTLLKQTKVYIKECPVCKVNDRDTVLALCGHVICDTCAEYIFKRTSKCPICLNIFISKFKIYL